MKLKELKKMLNAFEKQYGENCIVYISDIYGDPYGLKNEYINELYQCDGYTTTTYNKSENADFLGITFDAEAAFYGR